MKPRLLIPAILLCACLSIPAKAQVGEIIQKSAEHASKGYEGGSSSSAGLFFIDLAINGLVQWQEQRLSQRDQLPEMISLEVMLQAAVQPSTYYIAQPRIRANWGLFSTDFRLNYLLEETFDGVKWLRTDDWQILQLNIVSTPHVNVRVGGGFLHEAFGAGATFAEYTAAFSFQIPERRMGGMAEYRDSEPRKEGSINFQYRLFDKNRLHGYATIGGVFQQYYSAVNVWGIQTGLMFKLY